MGFAVLHRARPAGLAVAATVGALLIAGCGDVDRSSDPQRAVLRSAQEAADAATLDASELPGEWTIRQPPPTPALSALATLEERLESAFEAWRACALARVKGGFIGLGRAASAESEVYAGAEGAQVQTTTIVLARSNLVAEVLEEFRGAAAACVPQAPGLTSETGELVLSEPEPAPVAERVRVTVTLRGEQITETYDFVAVDNAEFVAAALMRNFEGNQDVQTQVVASLQSDLAEAASLRDKE